MSVDALMTQAVTITRVATGTVRDAYGNLPTSSTSTATVAYLEQQDAREIIVDRHTYVADFLGFLPAGTLIGPADRLTDTTGATYEVIGPPDTAYNPRTRTDSHIEVNLRVVSG